MGFPHGHRKTTTLVAGLRMAKTEFNTIQLRLLKLDARIAETAARVRIAFAAACPEEALIRHLALALMPAGP